MLAISALYSLHGPLLALSEDLAALEVLAFSIQGGQQAHRPAAHKLGKLSGTLLLRKHVSFSLWQLRHTLRGLATTKL